MRLTVLIILATAGIRTHAQELTGKQRDAGLGFEFTIPEGWAGVAGNGGYVLGHATIPGAILISANPHEGMDALKRAFTDPTDGETANLHLVGAPQITKDSTIKVTQTGTMQGTPVKVVATARLNPFGGNTANLMALAPAESFSAELEAALMKTQSSVRYTSGAGSSSAETGTIDQAWHGRLAATRLTYMESYSSPASVEGGIGGGYSIHRRIDLCPEGHYKTDSRSDQSFSGSEVSAYGSGSQEGSGRWQALRSNGASVLRLTSHEGQVIEYRLGFEDGKTFLNGERWFRTSLAADGPDYAPDCP